METKETPQFTHYCDRCQFLGVYKGSDLYVCARNNVMDTVIHRYGNDGPEYGSGLIFAQKGLIPELVEALKRAQALGMTERK